MTKNTALDAIFQRSLERVKNLGEVFTPPSSVEDMLRLLSQGRKGFWGDENHVFFEPNCGHGNIVIGIYRKRLQALYKKAPPHSENAALYAVANAINTLWAIDIDAKNVHQCRSRVFLETLVFLQQKTGIATQHGLIKQHKNFIAHLLCAINWHIHENETLSCLSDKKTAKANAKKTRSGAKWFAEHGHRPMTFDLSWTEYYQQCEQDNLADIAYQRALRFLDQYLAGKFRKSREFQFADCLAGQSSDKTKPATNVKAKAGG